MSPSISHTQLNSDRSRAAWRQLAFEIEVVFVEVASPAPAPTAAAGGRLLAQRCPMCGAALVHVDIGEQCTRCGAVVDL